jgi:hypothetical protein
MLVVFFFFLLIYTLLSHPSQRIPAYPYAPISQPIWVPPNLDVYGCMYVCM